GVRGVLGPDLLPGHHGPAARRAAARHPGQLPGGPRGRAPARGDPDAEGGGPRPPSGPTGPRDRPAVPAARHLHARRPRLPRPVRRFPPPPLHLRPPPLLPRGPRPTWAFPSRRSATH